MYAYAPTSRRSAYVATYIEERTGRVGTRKMEKDDEP